LEAGRNVRDKFELCHFSSYSLVSESSILNEKHLKSWLFQEKIADLGNTICSISINHKIQNGHKATSFSSLINVCDNKPYVM
jgi:hypothetical protein